MSKTEVTIAAIMGGAKGKIQRTSPVGVAVFPHLLSYDEYQLKENNKYECNTALRLDPADTGVQAFIDELDKFAEEAFEAGKVGLKERIDSGELKGKKLADAKKNLKDLVVHKPFEPDYDEEGEETGKVILRCKTQVAGVDKKTDQKWEREVPIFDAVGQKVTGKARASMKLWGGSRIAVAIQIIPFCAEGLQKAGISLRLGAVQVIELSGGSGTADDFGFGVEEDGFTADTFEAEAGETDSTSTESEADEADDDGDDEDF